MPTESYDEFLREELKDPEYAAEYLTACFEESPEVFDLAVKDVKDSNLSQESLRITLLKRYRTLLEADNPRLDSIEAIYKDFGGLPGIVPRASLDESRRLPGEVFASELLTQPITLKREKSGRILVTIDRNDVNDAVITTAGKTELCLAYVSGKEDGESGLKNKETEIQDFLVGKSDKKSMELSFDDLPLRWATGGVLSIVEFRGKTWTPFFFRDIEPYGWNLALGSSERYFDAGKLKSHIDDELNNPWQFIAREFLEETFVLDTPPRKGKNRRRKFEIVDIPNSQISEAQTRSKSTEEDVQPLKEQAYRFRAEHIKLRKAEDETDIESEAHSRPIEVTLSGTNTDIEIHHENKISRLDDVIVCFNLLDLGIEVVKVLRYELGENNYLLDGEVLEHDDGTKELVRMPVALISHDYLERVFGAKGYRPTYTPGVQPSIKEESISPDAIHIFGWDVIQRVKIKSEECDVGSKSEKERYEKWYAKFGKNFPLDEKDKPTNESPSSLFTPASVRILHNYFSAQRDYLRRENLKESGLLIQQELKEANVTKEEILEDFKQTRKDNR